MGVKRRGAPFIKKVKNDTYCKLRKNIYVLTYVWKKMLSLLLFPYQYLLLPFVS